MAKKAKGGINAVVASADSLKDIKASLTRHNDSFTTLLNLVPAKFYLPAEDQNGMDDTENNKKQTKAQRKELKRQEMESRSEAKRAAKKAKYDPSAPHTVTEIMQARSAMTIPSTSANTVLNGIVNKPANGTKDTSMQVDDEEDEDSENDSDFEGSEEDEAEAAPVVRKVPSTLNLGNPNRLVLGPTSIALSNSGAASPDGNVGSTSKDALLEERRIKNAQLREKRRKETRKRIEKERTEGTYSQKGKERESMSMLPLANAVNKPSKMSDIKKALKKEGKRQFFTDDNGEPLSARAQPSVPTPGTSALSKDNDQQVVPRASTSASAPEASSSIAFSSLDFAPSAAVHGGDAPKMSKKQREQLGKSTRTGVTSHDPAVALGALKDREQFLSKLTPQARERAQEKDKWERMAMRAGGTKVYDEEAKLQKMVKRKEKAKDKSRKDWADRKETAKNTQDKAIKKRNENIGARLQQKKDKKMGVKASKSVGKGNSKKKKGRPGFEGKGGSRK